MKILEKIENTVELQDYIYSILVDNFSGFRFYKNYLIDFEYKEIDIRISYHMREGLHCLDFFLVYDDGERPLVVLNFSEITELETTLPIYFQLCLIKVETYLKSLKIITEFLRNSSLNHTVSFIDFKYLESIVIMVKPIGQQILIKPDRLYYRDAFYHENKSLEECVLKLEEWFREIRDDFPV